MVFLDSNGKKIRFLQQAVAELDLTNVSILHQRVETLADVHYDQLVCRAYAALDTIVRDAQRLLRRGGVLLAMKSDGIKELASDKIDGFVDVRVHDLSVPFLGAPRALIEAHRQ